LTNIHGPLSSSILYFLLIAGVWGLVTAFRKRGVSSNYWGILAIGEIMIIVQAIIGVVLYVGEARPGRPGVHILYGIVAVITLPAYYAFSKGRDDRTAALLYGLFCIFVAGITLRSVTTGV
jgi:uncharacterized membrane protein